MKKVFLFMLLMLSLGMFSACSDTDDIANSSDGNVGEGVSKTALCNTWVLVSYGNESNEVLKEAKGYTYLLTFHSDGTYSGLAYGNEMGGKYKCNGKEIQITNPDITQVYYVGSDPDQFYLEHLSDVSTHTVSDTELRLYYSKDQYFKFRIKNDLS